MRSLIAAVVLALSGAPVAESAPTVDWPGAAKVQVADEAGALGGNVSGLAFAGPDELWAVRDGPGALLSLVRSGATWVPAPGWGNGRTLQYPDGHSGPDAEAVTMVPGEPGSVYVAAERDNAAGSRSHNSVLRFDVGAGAPASGDLKAAQEWQLEALLPATGANSGIEGLAWVPDDVLVASGLQTGSGSRYDPVAFPGHNGGLFVIGVEQTGELVFVALGANGTANRVASVKTGLAAVTEVVWDGGRRQLWAACDNTCDGVSALFEPAAGGFTLARLVRPPTGMAALNNEGLAIGSVCVAGAVAVVWSDDAATDRHALREATLPCAGATGPGSSTTSPTSPTSATTAAPSSTSANPSSAATSAAAATPTTAGGSADGGGSGKLIAAIGLGAAAVVGFAGLVARRRRPSSGS